MLGFGRCLTDNEYDELVRSEQLRQALVCEAQTRARLVPLVPKDAPPSMLEAVKVSARVFPC